MFSGQTINPASIGYNFQGDWSPAKVYERHDVVRYRGRTFHCKTNELVKHGLSGYLTSPEKDTTNWALHTTSSVNRGAWAPYKTHYAGDTVMYAGEWYQCQVDSAFNSHPIYKDGSLTSDWTKVFPKLYMSQPDRFIPYFGGQPPLGWQRNGGYVPDQGTSGGNGNWLIDFDGVPKRIGVGTVATGASNQEYIGAGGHPQTPGFQWIDFLRSSSPLTSITGGMPRCIQIIASGTQNYFLFDNGEVYSVGVNGGGELGNGGTTTRTVPMRVGRSEVSTAWNAANTTFRTKRIIKLAGGVQNQGNATSGAVAALASDGTVWVWGPGTRGQQGDGTITNSTLPTQIPTAVFNGLSIVDIFSTGNIGATGANNSFFAIDSEGFMWTWGDNTYGQIGRANNVYFKKPQRIGYDFNQFGGIKKFLGVGNLGSMTMVLCNNGSLHFAGRTTYFPFTGTAETDPGRTSTFMPAEQYLFKQLRATSSTSPAPWAWDLYKNIEDAWAHNGYLPALYMKEKDSNLMFFMGSGSGAIPNPPAGMSINSTTQNTSLTYSAAGTHYTPVMLTTGAMNDISYCFGFGGDDTATPAAKAGLVMINQDHRCKVVSSNNGEDAVGFGGDPMPINADTARQFNIFYLDEKNGQDDDIPITPRGGPSDLQIIHGQSTGSAGGALSGFATINALGIVGYHGVASQMTSNADSPSSFGGLDNAELTGRLRIV